MRSKSLLALVSLMVVASAASAQDYGRPGLYAALNGTASFDSIDGVDSDFLDNGIGVSGRVGYRFNPRLAAEGQIDWSGDFIDCCGADLTETMYTVNGKFFLMTDRLQPYGLLGMGYGTVDADLPGGSSVDEGGFAVKFGAGVDFYISESFGLMLEAAYNLGTGDLEEFNYTGLGWGLFVRF